MLSRTLGVGVMRKAIFLLLLPLSGIAHAESSTISPVTGSTVTVQSSSSAANVTAYQGGDWNVRVTTGTITSISIPVAAYKAWEGKKFNADTGGLSVGASAETPAVLFVNLSTNTVSAYVDEVRVSPRLSANTTPNSIIYRFYLSPVVTSSGTAQVISQCNTGKRTSSKMQFFTLPTVSSNGVRWGTIEAYGATNPIPVNGKLVLSPGYKMLVTFETGLIASQGAFFVTWWEE